MKNTRIYLRIDKTLPKRKDMRNSDFIEFVGNQFKQLARRNLGLPMKLYHL